MSRQGFAPGKPVIGMLMLAGILQGLIMNLTVLPAEAGLPFHWLRRPVFTATPYNLYLITLDDINRIRGRHQLAPLRMDGRLTAAAIRHARFMARTGRLEHCVPAGSNPGSRALQAGYEWRGIAENIAEGFDDPDNLVRAWMHSPEHRRHLLDPGMTDAGLGEANGFWALTLAHQ